MTTIDLNSDIGESFGRWTLGDDARMLEIVSSANIACGFHAGDPSTIRSTVTIAAQNGVAVGAHVGYRDLAGFGRRNLDVDPADLTADVIYQIGALQALAASAGTTVSYVKPHGALYNRIVHDDVQARAVVEAVGAVDPGLVVLGLPGSVVLELAADGGLATREEAFADRAYNSDGALVSRSQPDSVIHEPRAVAERVTRLAKTGTMTAIDGTDIQLVADSICVHGDSPNSVEMAAAVREQLAAYDVEIAPFAPTL